MTHSTSLHNTSPLELERVQSSRSSAGEIRLRMSGRWLEPGASVAEEEELLVVNLEGRRHRFPVSRDEAADPELAPDRWTACFTIPTWAEPREEGQAALWLGTAVVPVPPLMTSPGGDGDSNHKSGADGGAAPNLYPPDSRAESPAEPARSGPPADILLKDTVAALQTELEQRNADAAAIRGALAEVQAELDSRVGRHAQLEQTLSKLREELDRLRAAVQEQRAELEGRSTEAQELRQQLTSAQAIAERHTAEFDVLRADLAAAQVAREAAIGEAAGLRGELERLGSQLAVTREHVESETGDLGEANRLLADARALADEIRAGGDGG